jgi:hypothetical protein
MRSVDVTLAMQSRSDRNRRVTPNTATLNQLESHLWEAANIRRSIRTC